MMSRKEGLALGLPGEQLGCCRPAWGLGDTSRPADSLVPAQPSFPEPPRCLGESFQLQFVSKTSAYFVVLLLLVSFTLKEGEKGQQAASGIWSWFWGPHRSP